MMHVAYNGMGRRSTPVSDANRAKESYVRVTGTLLRRSANSLLIHADGRNVWVPLALIHGADEPKLDPDTMHDPVTFRVAEWKAMELGL